MFSSEVTAEMQDKIYNLIEQSCGKISKDSIQYEIRNNQVIYDNLYSDLIQRKHAMDKINFLNCLLDTLLDLGL